MQYPIIDLITSAYINNGWTGLTTGTRNLAFNGLKQGSYSYADGHYSYDINWVCSNGILIPCKPNTEYTLSFRVLNDKQVRWYGFVFYSIDKNYVGTQNERIITNNVLYTITTPENAYYLVIDISGEPQGGSFTSDLISELQIEEGNTKTSFVAPVLDFKNHLKLPLIHYFPHPVIDSLKHASDGTMTNKDKEILTHYLTPLGIGGI